MSSDKKAPKMPLYEGESHINIQVAQTSPAHADSAKMLKEAISSEKLLDLKDYDEEPSLFQKELASHDDGEDSSLRISKEPMINQLPKEFENEQPMKTIQMVHLLEDVGKKVPSPARAIERGGHRGLTKQTMRIVDRGLTTRSLLKNELTPQRLNENGLSKMKQMAKSQTIMFKPPATHQAKVFTKTVKLDKKMAFKRRGSGDTAKMKPVHLDLKQVDQSNDEQAPFKAATDQDEAKGPLSSHLKQFYERKTMGGEKLEDSSPLAKIMLANTCGRHTESLRSLHHLNSDNRKVEASVQSQSFVAHNRLGSGNNYAGGASPNRKLGSQSSQFISNRLHDKVAWFYKRLCEEYECPILPQFLQQTIPTAFKPRCTNRKKVDDNDLFARNSQDQYTSSKAKTVSGVVQINTSMLSEKTVAAVCDTLRRFQQKIKVVELYHNLAAKGGGSASGQNSPIVSYRLSSPQRTFANAAASNWSFPRPSCLINLLKSLTKTTIVRVVSDTDCTNFLSETHYQAFIGALGRQAVQDDKGNTQNVLLRKKNLFSTIDIQGFHVKPSFVKCLVQTIRANKMSTLVTLQLQNCAIQDSEGQELCKAVILGKKTPALRNLQLSKNQLGFKFGAGLIATLIDAQSIAQEETMQAVTKQGESPQEVIKFESLDHFALEKIDLEYNKLSHLVIQTVSKLLKNLHQFKEQAKIHQNKFQMQSKGQQQGSSLLAHTLGGFGTGKDYDMQPNNMIIEQTEESSISSSQNTLQDSIDVKDLRSLFDDFIASGRKSPNAGPNRLKSVSGNRLRSLDNAFARGTASSKTPNTTLSARGRRSVHQFSEVGFGIVSPQSKIKSPLRGRSKVEERSTRVMQNVETESARSKSKEKTSTQQQSQSSFFQLKQFSQAVKQAQQRSKKQTAVARQRQSVPENLSPSKGASLTAQLMKFKQNQSAEQLKLESPSKPNEMTFEALKRSGTAKKVLNVTLDNNELSPNRAILVSEFLDNSSLIDKGQSSIEPFRLTQLSKDGKQKSSKVQRQSQQPSQGKKIKPYVSPTRGEMSAPQKPASSNLKDKMVKTVTQIDNFMDPESVKARTDFSVKLTGVDQGKRLDKQKSKVKKKKTRQKVEGFFSRNDSHFANTQAKPKVHQTAQSLLVPGKNSFVQLDLEQQKVNLDTPCFSGTKEQIDQQSVFSSAVIPFSEVLSQTKKQEPLRHGQQVKNDSTMKLHKTNMLKHKSPKKTTEKGTYFKSQKQPMRKMITKKSKTESVVSASDKQQSRQLFKSSSQSTLDQYYEVVSPKQKVSRVSSQARQIQKSNAAGFYSKMKGHAAQAALTEKNAPKKQLGLTKSISATGDMVTDSNCDTEEMPFDEMATMQQLGRMTIQQTQNSQLKPTDLLTPPTAQQKSRMDAQQSSFDSGEHYFPELKFYSIERNDRRIKSYMPSTLNSVEHSRRSSPHNLHQVNRQLFHSLCDESISIYNNQRNAGSIYGRKQSDNLGGSFVSVTDQQQASINQFRLSSRNQDPAPRENSQVSSVNQVIVFDQDVAIPPNALSEYLPEGHQILQSKLSESSKEGHFQSSEQQLLRGLVANVKEVENSSDSFEVPAEELNPRFPVQQIKQINPSHPGHQLSISSQPFSEPLLNQAANEMNQASNPKEVVQTEVMDYSEVHNSPKIASQLLLQQLGKNGQLPVKTKNSGQQKKR